MLYRYTIVSFFIIIIFGFIYIADKIIFPDIIKVENAYVDSLKQPTSDEEFPTSIIIPDTCKTIKIHLYCEQFYHYIDDAVLLQSSPEFKYSLNEVLKRKKPFLTIENQKDIEEIKKIFYNKGFLIDISHKNYMGMGEFFLEFENNNSMETFSFFNDSHWIYNQKYRISYSTKPLHELMNKLNIFSLDCTFSTTTNVVYNMKR